MISLLSNNPSEQIRTLGRSARTPQRRKIDTTTRDTPHTKTQRTHPFRPTRCTQSPRLVTISRRTNSMPHRYRNLIRRLAFLLVILLPALLYARAGGGQSYSGGGGHSSGGGGGGGGSGIGWLIWELIRLC